MEPTSVNEAYDLLILADATMSMSNYLASLRQSLPQIISISALTNCFERLGLLAYRDYCDNDIVEWSGWMEPSKPREGQPDLVELASKLRASGGGDAPEATKTGLATAYSHMRSEATTLVLLFTDAPPHMRCRRNHGGNAEKERQALSDPDQSEKHSELFTDWVSAGHTLRDGERRAQVFSVLEQGQNDGSYEFLSALTNGAAIYLESSRPEDISKVTVETLLAWMGVRKPGSECMPLPGSLFRYTNTDSIISIRSEMDDKASMYFETAKSGGFTGFETLGLSTDVLELHLPKKVTPLQDFAKSYKGSGTYRNLVFKQLREIIERDVSAISLNPVFGSLWREVCNDRNNDHRQELLDLFGLKVEGLSERDGQKQRMKTWLAESYDYTAEVVETINEVPESQRFPCVCLDPTLAFTRQEDSGAEESDNQPITSFRRDELLEIGRSCDYRILRRLGRVLTRLTFVKSADVMPAHIAATSESDVPRIPTALASPEYGRRFWRILLHIVVPGTMLGARSAALLAALSLKMGVEPLRAPAEQEMMLWRDKWNDIEIPETWSVNCLLLLLDANKAFVENHDATADHQRLLRDEERLLFQCLVDYKMVEINLDTTLTAKVGWTPNKTTIPIGPVVVCEGCGYPRSVTIMGAEGLCGMCLTEFESEEHKRKAKSARVSELDDETSNAVWCECTVRTCRAQYVVYCVEMLNVRPKCHYCRGGECFPEAPAVECVKCLSRMIWPIEYRRGQDLSRWTCAACTSGMETIGGVETTANQIREENGQGWLLRNNDQKLQTPFDGRSLYNTISNAAPLGDFNAKVDVLPGKSMEQLELFHKGKLIRNTPALLDQLYLWVSRRRTERGTCSLCIADFRKPDVLPACGRSGCSQRICKSCLAGWYGLNGAGRIINSAALCCPFCRRAPTAKTLARYGMGIHAVGHLREAVRQSGGWIYAWCERCGVAKQYIERVCANGPPPELAHWTCDDCREETAQGKGGKTKNCPGCGTPTQKVAGCDHIQCTVPGCGVHWCFFCGEKCDERTIYGHMSEKHGGYFYGGDGGDEEWVAHDYDDESD